jgi:hypothetical protein
MDGAFYGLDSMEQLYLERNQVRFSSFFEIGTLPYYSSHSHCKKVEVIPTYVLEPQVTGVPNLPGWRIFFI